MTTTKPQSLQLQRRSGLRRPSFPASPTSPGQAFFRRNTRSVDLHSPQDVFATGPSLDSPSLDLDIPSPTFDIAAISPGLVNDPYSPNPKTSPADRSSADYGRQRPKLNTDLPRPSTSGAVPSLSSFRSSRPGLPTEGASYDSQVSSRYRDDFHRRAESSDEGPGPALVTAVSPSIGNERGFGDDGNAARLQNKKSKLNFSNLNPMSLLARRRSSQNTNKLDDPSINVPKLQVPAMKDFDPSIRGSFIHDFSAPRTRRANNENSPRPGPSHGAHYPRRPSEHSAAVLTPRSAGPSSAHSPMFKEHFQDDRNAIQPTNTAYLHTASLQAPDADFLPTFARRLPLQIPENHSASETALHDFDEEEQDTLPPPPEPLLPPPPPPPKRTPSPKPEIPPQVTTLPKHMTSTSSRFSYIGQQGSIAEEKLLEERHKEHALRFPTNPRESVAASDVDDYDFGDDGLEEAIPGVNADYEDDGLFDNDNIPIRNIDVLSSMTQPPQQPLTSFNNFDDDGDFDDDEVEIRNIDIPTSYLRNDDSSGTQFEALKGDSRERDSGASKEGKPQSQDRTREDVGQLVLNRNALQNFHFTPQSMTFSPTSTHHPSEPTPRDSQGFAIGLAESDDLEKPNSTLRIRDSAEQSPENLIYQGLGITTEHTSINQRQETTNSQHPFDDSELYFDDGEFGDEFDTQGDTFDETLLDRENDHIRDIPAENARRYQEALGRSHGNHEQVKLMNDKPAESTDQFDSSTLINKRSSVGPQVNLTEDNLAAYHDALALAATRAAANGKFERSVSFNQASDDETDSPFHQQAASQSRGSRYSNNYNFESSGVSDDDVIPFDSDDMDDDAMIAAANAEALENDDEGFYGSEFGFYARAYGKNSEDMVSGGFFASRGSNGVKRSHSGKNNFQEPSLTPITERSEWSTRNSVASLPLHTGIPSAHSHPSPGLAHLLQQDSPIAEDEMSLKALMRLRGRTFGSSSSIGSLPDTHTGSSPRAQMTSYKFPALNTDTMHAGRISSPTPGHLSASSGPGPSIPESSDEDDEYDRPTMTQNTPARKSAKPVPQPISTASLPPTTHESLPSSPIPRKQGSNHSRNSSGADSVSYAKEKDGRWLLERRRTGDDGELELIAREYLAGTRI